MEPWTITTVYPDGTTEERLATPEEVAQREADLLAFEQQKADEAAAQAQKVADIQASQTELAAMGLSDKTIETISGYPYPYEPAV